MAAQVEHDLLGDPAPPPLVVVADFGELLDEPSDDPGLLRDLAGCHLLGGLVAVGMPLRQAEHPIAP